MQHSHDINKISRWCYLFRLEFHHIHTKSSSDASEITWSFLVCWWSEDVLVLFIPCKQFGSILLDLVGNFIDEFFKLNPIIFRFFPSRDCRSVPGTLEELIFPTSFSALTVTSCVRWVAARAIDSTGTSFPSIWFVKTKETCKSACHLLTVARISWKSNSIFQKKKSLISDKGYLTAKRTASQASIFFFRNLDMCQFILNAVNTWQSSFFLKKWH